MLVSRRSAEKHASGKMNALALSWLQQAAALPIIFVTLFFARFYWPAELSAHYWEVLALYAALVSLDTFLYFKALSIADVSYVAPLLTLVALGNILGAYIILDQVPSTLGIAGAAWIVVGAVITYRGKRRHDTTNHHNNKLALLFVLMIVAERAITSSIEVPLLRESNPTTFNLYSSLLSVPILIAVSLLVIATNKSKQYKEYWRAVKTDVVRHRWLLSFIGLTYTVNMLATYGAKLIAPNAGYVGAVKSASVLPIVLIGVLFFKEKLHDAQWLGLGFITAGLVCLGLS